MKKILLIIGVLVLLQLVFVSATFASGPNDWRGGHGNGGYWNGGYNHGYGYQPNYGYNYQYHSRHPYYYSGYNNCYPRYHYTYSYNNCCRPYYGYQNYNYRHYGAYQLYPENGLY